MADETNVTAMRWPPGKTLGAQLANEIERRMLVEGWEPGRLIGSEAQLCRTYGVGTAAAREAARILESRGLAVSRRGPGGGMFVSRPDQSLVTDAARRYLGSVGVRRADLFEVWLALEQMAIARLVERIDAEGASRLRQTLDKEQIHRPHAWTELPNIHLEIVRQSGNPVLELFIRVLSELSLHAYGAVADPRPLVAWLHSRHEDIVEAIIAGDAALAQLHLRRFIDAVKRQDFSPQPTEESGDTV